MPALLERLGLGPCRRGGAGSGADLLLLLSLAVTSCTPRTPPALTVACLPRCSAAVVTLL